MNRVLPICILLLLLPACAGNALLDQVSIDPETIAPYAGSPNLAATIRYAVSREATVSIYFVDAQGQPHYFRRDQPRPAGSYDAAFSGAIDDRVLPDGAYEVVIEAKDANGQSAQAKKKLNITNADATPPQLLNYTVFPDAFTPNQDGIADRVTIRYFLSKPAKVDVYLTDGKTRYEVAEKKTTLAIKDGLSQAGAHEYDYDGGIDLLASPPPDGTYTVVADALDAIGNRTRAEKKLTIKDSGIPRATISNSGVDWSSQPVPGGIAQTATTRAGNSTNTENRAALLVPLGGTLTFTVTVQNVGPVPIRTKGPEPGTVYSTSENYNAKKEFAEPGIFRVGLDFEGNSEGRQYPFRWQLGSRQELTRVVTDGKEYFYLMPGQRVTVSGSVRIVDKPPRINTYFWVGLAQEDVRIVEDHVEPRLVTIEY